MKNLLTILICLFTFNVYAQKPCEFNRGNYSTDDIYMRKVLETNSGDYVVGGVMSVYNTIRNASLGLTKISTCGDTLWRVKHHTAFAKYNNVSIYADIGNVIELDDKELIYVGAFRGKLNQNSSHGIFLTRTDSNGNMLNSAIVGDTTKEYNLYDFIQLSSNRFLALGSDITVNPSRAFAIMLDTLGNTIFEKKYYSDSLKNSFISGAFKQAENVYTLLGIEDSSMLIINIDSVGQTTNFSSIQVRTQNLDNSGRFVIKNTNNSEIIYTCRAQANAPFKIYIARYTNTGALIKETILPDTIRPWEAPSILKNNQIAVPSFYDLVVLDSSFNILQSHKITGFHAIQTSDGCLVTNASGSGIIQKISLYRYIRNITLNGPNTITQKNGQAQFTPAITPTDAANQQLIWSISDTNIASITQTGLVTAKNNGMVTIITSTTDGSNITSFKTITITNQTVGINELLATENQVTLYPNPAQNQLTVVCNVAQIQAIHLLELSGKMLHTFTNNTTINLSQCASGMYLVKIETDKGTVFKKLIISK